ncbi:SET domain-containing protein 3, partial [Coemansia sp. RSA 2681]
MLPATLAATRDNGGDSTPDEDQGVIRCICNIDDDDGFTIQCENCLVWQHAVCVNVNQDNVPDEYLCEKCNPRKLDVKRAVDYQKRRLETESRNVKEARKRPKYVGGKVKRADDPSERRKRAPDAKTPRPKTARTAGSRESSSPASMPTGREVPVIFDGSYTTIDHNILGADVQVLFQSVLSQLAAEAAAGTEVQARPGSETNEMEVSARPSNESNKVEVSARPSNESSERAAVVNSEMAPALVAMPSSEMAQAAPVYRGFASSDRAQIGLFARSAIAAGRYICEYRGQVQLKAAYKEDPKNYYELLRTTRPHSHFYPDIDLCVDARRQGSDARCVRRSCAANAALRSMHDPAGGDSAIRLGLFATRGVQADEELTVGWEWGDGELPAVARMAAGDAEDYLGRPEGRRMSKVWRQAFGGITCACADAQCGVRRLFAMLGVEEAPARPDAGAAIRRRPSRPHKSDADAADAAHAEQPPADRAVAAHSRKGSAAGLRASPESPLAGRGAATASASANGDARSMLSIAPPAPIAGDCSSDDDELSHHQHSIGHQQQPPANGRRSSAAAMERVPSRNSSNSSAKSRSQSQSRKRKPGAPAQAQAQAQAHDAAGCALGAEGGKRPRSASGSPVPRKASSPGCSLPLKKLWMSQYLERADVRGGGGCQSALLPPAAGLGACPSPKRAYTMPLSSGAPAIKIERDAEIERGAEIERDVEMSEATPFEREASRPPEPARSPSPSPLPSGGPVSLLATVRELSPGATTPGDDQALVKSLPTDADAPTPPPTDAAALLEQPLPSGTACGSRVAPVSLDAPDSGLASEGPSTAQAEPREDAAAAATAAADPSAKSAAPVKKQRLSLEEYNKRRRGNTATPASGEAEAKEGDGESAAPKPAEGADP